MTTTKELIKTYCEAKYKTEELGFAKSHLTMAYNKGYFSNLEEFMKTLDDNKRVELETVIKEHAEYKETFTNVLEQLNKKGYSEKGLKCYFDDYVSKL